MHLPLHSTSIVERSRSAVIIRDGKTAFFLCHLSNRNTWEVKRSTVIYTFASTHFSLLCAVYDYYFLFFLCFTLGSIYRRFFFSSTLFYCEEATIWLKAEEAWHKYCFFSCVSPTLFSVYLFIYHSCFFLREKSVSLRFAFFFFSVFACGTEHRGLVFSDCAACLRFDWKTL